ncbi:MAG: DUF4115 domain-containing protein [Alphaproteobacteria bacterium]|nr:DUF4115 domain-containing protein [Alphaproteobacteria bacterium]
MPSSRNRRTPPSSRRPSSGDSRPGSRAAQRVGPPPPDFGNNQSAPAFELDRIGDLLRRARGQRGEKLDAISAYLRIRPGFLAALENSRYEELPADAYVIGFLRSYANYLGLDSREVIDHYRREMAGRRRRPQLNMPQPISEGRAPTAPVLIAALLAAILIYALWYGLSSSSQDAAKAPPPLPQTAAQTESAPPQKNAPGAAAVSAESPALAAPPPPSRMDSSKAASMILPSSANQPQTPAGIFVNGPSAAADLEPPVPPKVSLRSDSPPKAEPPEKGEVYGETSAPARLVLRAEKESWVLVADSRGNTLFDKILKPGDVYNVPAAKDLRLTTGNGNGVVLSLDGTDLPRLASDSRLVRNVPLDPEGLKAGKTQPSE